MMDEEQAVDEKKPKFVSQNNLKRTLKSRHMSMIAIGGTIGTGLFVASGNSLSVAGPAGALVSYTLVGIIIFFVMTSLAEMSTYIPVSGSFNSFADRFVDPAFGFAIAYNYYYNWVVANATDLVAGGIIMQYWLPNVNTVIWSLIMMAIIVFLNLFGAKLYGEAEFWLALIKVLAIVAFIIIGILVAAGAVGGKKYAFSNWSIEGAPFVGGVPGIIKVFVVAGFSFQGTEVIGITAGESSNPSRDVPKTIRSIFWRILLFYILTIFVVGLVVPYNDENLVNGDVGSLAKSPLVIVMEKAGLKSASDIMNAVVLTSVLSAGNSGQYITSRILTSLAIEGKSWSKFTKVTKQGTPIYSLAVGTVIVCILFGISFIGNQVVYTWLVDFAGVAGFLSWSGILFTHWRFRRAYKLQGYDLKDLPYQAGFYPFGPFFSFFCLIFVVLSQGYQSFLIDGFHASDFIKSYSGIPLFLIMLIGYKWKRKTKMIALEDIDLETDSFIQLGFPSVRHEKTTWKDVMKSIIH
ncbi:Lysine-specific permease [Smittium mucronatum]|uniref:Lysine-specific permease n=1 Tax=Smittium mucronatum TaxID=133383 RepID=A0A1R0GV00_9FUNG|nr:Lysine-specific permease [Smittium mucronatum]